MQAARIFSSGPERNLLAPTINQAVSKEATKKAVIDGRFLVSSSKPQYSSSSNQQNLRNLLAASTDKYSRSSWSAPTTQKDLSIRNLLAASTDSISASKVSAQKVRAANDRALLAGKVGSQEKILGKATVTTNARRTRAGTN